MMKKKVDVICDTNTWYDIAKGSISEKNLSNLHLHSTYISLFELVKTPALIKDWLLVKRAIQALLKHSHSIFLSNPIEYIIKKQFPEYEFKDQEAAIILNNLREFVNRNDDKAISEDELKKLKESVSHWRELGSRTVSFINEQLPDIRQKIKSGIGKDNHRKINTYPLITQVINRDVEKLTGGEISLNSETYPWQDIQLLIMIWADFFRELEVHSNMKMHANDWQDIFAMTYVMPGMKFATREKKWIELIQKNKHTKEYLIRL